MLINKYNEQMLKFIPMFSLIEVSLLHIYQIVWLFIIRNYNTSCVYITVESSIYVYILQ